MFLAKSSKRNLALFSASVLLCGFLKVAFDGVGFTECFSRLYYGVLVLLWALSIQERIINVRLRNLLLLIAALILLCSMLQAFRYQLFYDHATVQRYLMYARFVPMMAISLLLVYVSLNIYCPMDKPVSASYKVLVCIGVLLTLGVLTNDIHFQAFRFPGQTLIDCENRERGWLSCLFMIFLFIAAFLYVSIILKKRQEFVSRKWCCIPVLPVAFEALYAALYAFGLIPKYGGIPLWEYGEIFSVCTITFLEICIQLGMIPANTDYGKLFSAASYPAVILDRRGEPVYRTMGAQYPFQESEDIQIVRHPITGGSIAYTVDVRFNRSLTEQLLETTRQLEARNAYLEEDNRIKQEMAALESRNQLYNRISRIIRPQLSAIDALMNDAERSLEEKLPKVALLKTYIKRRSNLELLAYCDPLPVGELTAAIAESLECMRICGIHTSVASFCTGAFPSNMLIAAYEQFETIVEESFDTLSYINVSVSSEKRSLILRLMLKTDCFTYESENKRKEYKGFSCKTAITKEEQDIHVAFVFVEGGA